jgi:hypothetical protein
MYSNTNDPGNYDNQKPIVYNQVNINQNPNNMNNNFQNNNNMNNNNYQNNNMNMNMNMNNNYQNNNMNNNNYQNNNMNNNMNNNNYQNNNINNNMNNNNYQNNNMNNMNMNNNYQNVNNQVMMNQQGGLQICLDPMQQLAESVQCYVRQQYCLFEMMTGCDTANVYDVYSRNQFGQITFLFRCKEESSCCSKVFCSGQDRPLRMNIKHVQNLMIGDPTMIPNFAYFDKPFKCTCMCFNRPYLEGFYCNNESNPRKFGKINFPFTCCDCSPYFETEDLNHNQGFKIYGGCYQCGLWCGCCADAKFGIYKSDCSDMVEQNQVGTVIKKKGDVLTEMFTKVDNFEIVFPTLCSPEDKLLLIGSTIMLDYLYFEEEQDKNNNN